jgi:hypothetical protein
MMLDPLGPPPPRPALEPLRAAVAAVASLVLGAARWLGFAR